MSSSGPAPSRKKMSGSGCQASCPPASIVAETPSGRPIEPLSISERASWKAPPRKTSGAQPTRRPLRVGEVEELGRRGRRHRERLLRVHVLARLERGPRHIGVDRGRREVQDDVHVPAGEEIVDRGRREAVRGRERLAPERVTVGARDDLEAVERRRVLGIRVADHAAADDADTGRRRHARTSTSDRRTASDSDTAANASPAVSSCSTISHSTPARSAASARPS